MDTQTPTPLPRPRRAVTIRADTQSRLDLIAAAFGIPEPVALNMAIEHGLRSLTETAIRAGLVADNPLRVLDRTAFQPAELDVTNE